MREAGVIIDDGKMSLIALNGLDSSYDPLVTSQTAKVDEICFSSLLGLVRFYEARLNHDSEPQVVATANAVQGSQYNNKYASMVCQIYDMKGHTTLACVSPSQRIKIPINPDQGAWMVQEQGSSTSTVNAVWYPDSGASDHVSDNFSSIQVTNAENNPKSLTVANGKSFP